MRVFCFLILTFLIDYDIIIGPFGPYPLKSDMSFRKKEGQ